MSAELIPNSKRSTETKNLVKEIIDVDPPAKAGLGEYGRWYFNKLPTFIANKDGGMSLIHKEKLKRSFISQNTIMSALNQITNWESLDSNKARVLLTHTLPAMLASSEVGQNGSEKASINKTVEELAKQVGEGSVKIITPACPPYDYCRDRNGDIKHMSGQILPTFGDRFEAVATTIRQTFEPLMEHGVNVSFEVCTYTGETGNVSDLVDLGVDVQEHYRGREGELFKSLRSCTNDARFQLETHLGKHGIGTKLTSIEKLLGPAIENTVSEYQERFPNNLKDLGTPQAHMDIRNWLNERFGVREWWLMFYEEQERKYRENQNRALAGHKAQEPLVVSALKEGLLYLLFTKYAKEQGKLVWDLETTDNYMLGTLRHLKDNPAPVIMGAAYNPNKPDSRHNIRQPFNTPIDL